MKILSLLTLSFVFSLLAGTGLRAAEIVSVEHLSESRGDYAGLPGPSGLGTDKFSGRELPAGREEIVVTWSAGRTPVSAGAQMVLEYQRTTETKIRTLAVKFPMEVSSRRETRFETSRDGARFFGDVSRWRVRLEHAGQVLAEAKSEAWE